MHLAVTSGSEALSFVDPKSREDTFPSIWLSTASLGDTDTYTETDDGLRDKGRCSQTHSHTHTLI